MTFVRIARALGTALVCATAVAACSGSEDVGSVSGPTEGSGTESEPTNWETIGRFRVTVDPTAAEPVVFQPIEEEGLPGPGTQSTAPLQPNLTVTSSISLVGPGVWHSDTQILDTTVVMTHTGAIAQNFNEPQIVITSITDKSGLANAVQFITTDNPGVTGVGATMAFADLERPGFATPACGATVGVRSSTNHYFAIKYTGGKTFSFDSDVRAQRTAGAVKPDCDNDGFNTENQDSGNDCNDANVNQHTACTCSDGCNLAGATCQQPVTSGAFTCNSTCDCDVNGAGGTDVNVTCQQDCTVDCAGASDGADIGGQACINTCQGQHTCSLDCSDITVGDCNTACNGKANCTLNCSGTNAGTCENTTCAGRDTTCSTSCEGSGTSCGVATCGNNATCDVICGSPTSASNYSVRCGVATCGRGSICTVACVNPGPLGCVMACNANSATCEMDCSAIPAANRNALCKLTCPGGATKVQDANGVFRCP